MRPTNQRDFLTEIRRLQSEEINQAVELFGRQLRDHQMDGSLWKLRDVISQILKDPRLGFVLAAFRRDEGLIGVALGCAFLGIEHGGWSGWMEELYVLPQYREKGVGSLLIAEFIRVAAGLGWRAIDLEVDSSHRRVVSLYQRHGFQKLTRSRFYRPIKPTGN
jgi:ribosomal protein S18 acetylase RimI-like enzyme